MIPVPHTSLKLYEAARIELRSFKDSLFHQQKVKLKDGRIVQLWVFHELWDDDVDCVLYYNPETKDGLWKGMQKISISELDEVLEREP